MEISGPVSLILPLERELPSSQKLFCRKIVELFSDGRDFTAQEARAKLGLSSTVFKRFASEAIASGAIERFGGGMATKYRVRSPELGLRATG